MDALVLQLRRCDSAHYASIVCVCWFTWQNHYAHALAVDSTYVADERHAVHCAPAAAAAASALGSLALLKLPLHLTDRSWAHICTGQGASSAQVTCN
jgi:hypothetical protein